MEQTERKAGFQKAQSIPRLPRRNEADSGLCSQPAHRQHRPETPVEIGGETPPARGREPATLNAHRRPPACCGTKCERASPTRARAARTSGAAHTVLIWVCTEHGG